MHKDIVSLMHGVCCYGRAPEGHEETQAVGGRSWRLNHEVFPAWSDVPMVGSASQLELCRALHHFPSSHHYRLPSAIVKGGLEEGRTLLRVKAVTVPTSSVCLWLLKHLLDCRTRGLQEARHSLRKGKRGGIATGDKLGCRVEVADKINAFT